MIASPPCESPTPARHFDRIAALPPLRSEVSPVASARRGGMGP